MNIDIKKGARESVKTEPILQNFNLHVNQFNEGYVVELNGEEIGMFSISVGKNLNTDPLIKQSLILHILYIIPTERRTDIFNSILEKIEKIAIEKGIVSIITNSEDTSLYEQRTNRSLESVSQLKKENKYLLKQNGFILAVKGHDDIYIKYVNTPTN